MPVKASIVSLNEAHQTQHKPKHVYNNFKYRGEQEVILTLTVWNNQPSRKANELVQINVLSECHQSRERDEGGETWLRFDAVQLQICFRRMVAGPPLSVRPQIINQITEGNDTRLGIGRETWEWERQPPPHRSVVKCWKTILQMPELLTLLANQFSLSICTTEKSNT